MGFIILSLGEENLILFPIIFLIILSILGGSIFRWLIFPYFNLILLPFFLKILTLVVCIIGGIIGYVFFNKLKIKNIYFFIKLNYYLSLIWFIPLIFCYFLNYYFLILINKYKIYLDLGWIEFFGGRFLINFYYIYLYYLNFFKFKKFFYLIIIFIIFLLFI